MGFGERWVMVGPAAGSLWDDESMSPKKSKDTKVQKFQLQGGAPQWCLLVNKNPINYSYIYQKP